MELNIFPRGEVSASRRVIIGESCQDAQLFRLQRTGSNFYAQHLEARLPLAIRAVFQAKWAELFRCDRAAQQLLDALFEAAYFRFDGLTAVSFFDFG